MSLVKKEVMVEDKVDDLMSSFAATIKAIHSGQAPIEAGMQLLLKLGNIIDDVKALPAQYAESFSGTVKAIELGATDIAAALLGKN